MKKATTLLTLLSFLFVTGTVVQSCSKDDDKEDPQEPAQFEATNSTFADFKTWTLRATIQGPDPAIGNLHGPNDSTVTRNVYVKDNQAIVNGAYPQGTVIVKHSSNPGGTVDEYTAMVKRGGNFNTADKGWEWFILNSDGTIKSRGAKISGVDCGGCHSGASKDFVYTTP